MLWDVFRMMNVGLDDQVITSHGTYGSLLYDSKDYHINSGYSDYHGSR